MIVPILILIGGLIILFTFIINENWYEIKKVFKKIEYVDPILKEKRLSILKSQYRSLEETSSNEAKEKDKSNYSYFEKQNNQCPKCGSSRVNDRIKRVQGELDGSISGSSFLFSGYMSGSIHGELDTNEVNKCNDCQHEWKKEKYHWVVTSEIIDSKLDTIYYYLWGIGQSKKVKFDENDLTEKFNSLQEKKAFELNKSMNDSWRIDKIKKDWGNYSIELITKLLDEHRSHNDYIEFGIDLELIFKTKLGLKHIDEFIKDEL